MVFCNIIHKMYFLLKALICLFILKRIMHNTRSCDSIHLIVYVDTHRICRKSSCVLFVIILFFAEKHA